MLRYPIRFMYELLYIFKDNLLDELEQHIPTGKSKIKIMMKNLKSGAGKYFISFVLKIAST